MQPYIGQILLVPFNFAPEGWAFCDGSLLNISEYTALFTLIGTTFGGDGQSTFALPDLRGRVPVHVGTGYTLGTTGGSETVQLVLTQMPSHTHALNVSSAPGTSASPSGGVPAKTTDAIYAAGTASTVGGTTAILGSGLPHENRQPYQVLQYIIAMEGVFPTQS